MALSGKPSVGVVTRAAGGAFIGAELDVDMVDILIDSDIIAVLLTSDVTPATLDAGSAEDIVVLVDTSTVREIEVGILTLTVSVATHGHYKKEMVVNVEVPTTIGVGYLLICY